MKDEKKIDSVKGIKNEDGFYIKLDDVNRIIQEEKDKTRKETPFSLRYVIKKITSKECLLCKTNLDKDQGKGKWHIPLCKKHRLEYLKNEK
jgi:hypothetical protein